jgi:ATP-binding cassette, subfamily B, bacterial
MDSRAEAEWFDRLRKLSAGRTATVTTHRFTTAMRDDLIHVMNDGQVIESWLIRHAWRTIRR